MRIPRKRVSISEITHTLLTIHSTKRLVLKFRALVSLRARLALVCTTRAPRYNSTCYARALTNLTHELRETAPSLTSQEDTSTLPFDS